MKKKKNFYINILPKLALAICLAVAGGALLFYFIIGDQKVIRQLKNEIKEAAENAQGEAPAHTEEGWMLPRPASTLELCLLEKHKDQIQLSIQQTEVPFKYWYWDYDNGGQHGKIIGTIKRDKRIYNITADNGNKIQLEDRLGDYEYYGKGSADGGRDVDENRYSFGGILEDIDYYQFDILPEYEGANSIFVHKGTGIALKLQNANARYVSPNKKYMLVKPWAYGGGEQEFEVYKIKPDGTIVNFEESSNSRALIADQFSYKEEIYHEFVFWESDTSLIVKYKSGNPYYTKEEERQDITIARIELDGEKWTMTKIEEIPEKKADIAQISTAADDMQECKEKIGWTERDN